MTTKRPVVASVSWDYIELGARLGSGSFCCVYRVRLPTSSSLATFPPTDCSSEVNVSTISEEDATVASSLPSSSSVSSSFSSGSGGLSGYYALKKCHGRSKRSLSLLREANVLSDLPSHKNIISLYAISCNFWADPFSGFLLLEELECTLEQAIGQWKSELQRGKPGNRLFGNILNPGSRLLACLVRPGRHREKQAQRIRKAALGVAQALEFLHRRRILYRDIKPSNVGFEKSSGCVKLFDFGLAVRLEDGATLKRVEGTRRYMAPEVMAADLTYSFPSDVHSFAILLWEVCTLDKAFSGVSTVEALKEKLIDRQGRPPLRVIASPIIRHILKHGWDPDPSKRPIFAQITSELQKAVDLYPTSCVIVQ